ncbi:MAG: PilZ domain-containing protein [gamma proteobacterium symbiont of Taylorina sp.]|nr:PilZ domain-containing protein [gamma proteobacterium symbiont of Taylorina sp.]
MTDNISQDRYFQRIHFDCLVKFEVGDSRLDCELVDISFRGALIHNCTGATLDVGSPCRLILSLDESQEVQIIMQGNIAHKRDNRIGISCTSIDLDSMTHLRKLVEINLSSPELLEREIMSLCS